MCADTPEREITVQSRTPVYTLQGLHPHSRYRITIRAKTNVPGEAVTQEVTTPASGAVITTLCNYANFLPEFHFSTHCSS